MGGIGLLLLAFPLFILGGIGSAVSIPFIAFFSWRVFPPLWRAHADPTAENIQGAVKGGVLSLIPLDAAIAAAYAGPVAGFAVLTLLWIVGPLARRFAVT
jgi:4-hydroxybenzoate polyprenyltransferase